MKLYSLKVRYSTKIYKPTSKSINDFLYFKSYQIKATSLCGLTYAIISILREQQDEMKKYTDMNIDIELLEENYNEQKTN